MSISRIIRKANKDDLLQIVQMLVDDELGKKREVISDEALLNYTKAFAEIEQDERAEMLVLEIDDVIVATAQVNYLTYLTYQGGKRALIEAVRVHNDFRGQGIGEFFILEIVKRAKKNRCHMVQLTTNKARDRAKNFYEKLGFKATHEGMKLEI